MKTTARQIMVFLLLVSAALILDGCVTRLGDFTVLSTKNVDVGGLKPGDRFAGEDCQNIILWPYIPLGEPNWKNAMDQALEKGKGDVMVDIVLTMKTWGIPLIFGQNCIEIEGTVSQTASYKR